MRQCRLARGPVHITLEESENGGFTLKTRHMFFARATPEEFKTQQPLDQWFSEKTRFGKSYDSRNIIVFEKLCFQNVLRPHENRSCCFQIPPLKSVFVKLRYWKGLFWAVGLTLEIKLRFQIFPAWCARGLTGGDSSVLLDWVSQRFSKTEKEQ